MTRLVVKAVLADEMSDPDEITPLCAREVKQNLEKRYMMSPVPLRPPSPSDSLLYNLCMPVDRNAINPHLSPRPPRPPTRRSSSSSGQPHRSGINAVPRKRKISASLAAKQEVLLSCENGPFGRNSYRAAVGQRSSEELSPPAGSSASANAGHKWLGSSLGTADSLFPSPQWNSTSPSVYEDVFSHLSPRDHEGSTAQGDEADGASLQPLPQPSASQLHSIPPAPPLPNFLLPKSPGPKVPEVPQRRDSMAGGALKAASLNSSGGNPEASLGRALCKWMHDLIECSGLRLACKGAVSCPCVYWDISQLHNHAWSIAFLPYLSL